MSINHERCERANEQTPISGQSKLMLTQNRQRVFVVPSAPAGPFLGLKDIYDASPNKKPNVSFWGPMNWPKWLLLYRLFRPIFTDDNLKATHRDLLRCVPCAV